MEPFPKPLKLEFVDNPKEYRRRFKLTQNFEYHFNTKDSHECITVPVDYPTDFASVPRPLWPIFPPVGRYGKATVIHDYLCDHPEERPRQEADRIFHQAMKDLDVADWKIVCMYGAVSFWTTLLTVKQWLLKKFNIHQRAKRQAL